MFDGKHKCGLLPPSLPTTTPPPDSTEVIRIPKPMPLNRPRVDNMWVLKQAQLKNMRLLFAKL